MKRLALYVFWEKNGVVRDYVTYYLKALKKIAKDIIVIANGGVNPEGEQTLKNIGVELLKRENHGIDFGAWQDAIQQKGWDTLKHYDQLILCNCSTYGPVYPFQDMFNEMENRHCDFWGITKHPTVNTNFIPDNPETQILEHIQSYFIVFNKTAMMSEAFKDWWETLIPTDNYAEEVGLHETKLTHYLEKRGLKSDVYINTAGLLSDDASLFYADKLLIKKQLVLIKRKLFSDEAHQLNKMTLGDVTQNCFSLIENQTQYPTQYIWQDLLATQKMSAIKDALALNVILPSTSKPDSDTAISEKIALVCFSYYPDLVDMMVSYIQLMPLYTDIYILSSRQDTLNIYQKKLSKIKFNQITYRLKNNRGRDLSAYLVAASDLPEKYDYLCYIHDKKSPHLDSLVGENFFHHNIRCLMESTTYIQNIIHYFRNNPFCGMLVPPVISSASFSVFGNEIGVNKEYMGVLYQRCQLKIPFDNVPVAPFGSMFWCRGKALKSLFGYRWTYEDFPEEPMPIDGTISHAIERMFPMFIQDSGYYTTWCAPISYASIYMNNLAYQYREYNHELYQFYGVCSWQEMLKHLKKQTKYVKNLIGYSFFKRLKYKVLAKMSFGKVSGKYQESYKEQKLLRNQLKQFKKSGFLGEESK